MIKPKSSIARSLFVDNHKSLKEREQEDLDFAESILNQNQVLFDSRYKLVSVLSRGHHHQSHHQSHHHHHHHYHHNYHHPDHHLCHETLSSEQSRELKSTNSKVINKSIDSIEVNSDEGFLVTNFLTFIFWQVFLINKLTR